MTDVIDMTTLTDEDDAAPTLSLFDRLGGVYGIAGAVDVLADRLYENASANQNPHVQAFHS